jgi:hypothetical protein
MIHRKYFKNDEVYMEWVHITQTLKAVLFAMQLFCEAEGQEFLITDLISTEAEDIKYGRISDTHRDRRAADLRTKTWSAEFKVKFENHFETIFKSLAAISSKTGKTNLIEIHKGTEEHAHVQIARGLP